MKMQFLRRPRNRDRLMRYAPFSVLALMVLGLFAFQAGVPQVLESALSTLAAGMHRASNSTVATVDIAVRSLASEEDLVREIASLREELSEEKRKQYRVKLLEQENESLRLLLGRGVASTTQLHTAAVLARPAQTPYDTLLVDQGTEDGIQDGSLVLIQDGIAIGYVADTRVHTSLVRLFSSPGQVHAVVLTSSSTLVATAEGLGNGSFKMEVPRDIAVAVGDTISLQTLAPYLLGTVLYTETDEVDAFTTAYFTVPVALNELRAVLIDVSAKWYYETDSERIDTP